MPSLACCAVLCGRPLCRGAAAGRWPLKVATYGSNATCCSLRCNVWFQCNMLLSALQHAARLQRVALRASQHVARLQCVALRVLQHAACARHRWAAAAARERGTQPGVCTRGRSARARARGMNGHVSARLFVCLMACSLRAMSTAARAQTASQRRIGPTLQVCVQRTACNMQPTRCNMQHATCNRQHATDNMHMHHTDRTASLKSDLPKVRPSLQ
jgi:hypothetical protein